MKKIDTKIIIKIIGITLILIWMMTVFIFSNEKATESKVTSRKVTVAIVQAISGQDISDDEELLKDVDKVVRKLAHYTLYTIGGMLIISFIYPAFDTGLFITLGSFFIFTQALKDETTMKLK